jgi:hypothetical protein
MACPTIAIQPTRRRCFTSPEFFSAIPGTCQAIADSVEGFKSVKSPKLIRNWFRIAPQTIIAIVILFPVFLFQIYVSQLRIESILEHAVNDDTFYYLEVAHRASNGEGFTFDGINNTNGFQPAWGFLLTVVASFIEGKVTLLRSALLVATLFNLVTGILIYRLSSSIFAKQISAIPLFVWSSAQLAPEIALSGLETSMNWTIFVITLWYLVKMIQRTNVIHSRDTRTSYLDFIIIGILCGLLFLVRVDNIIYIVLIITMASSLFSYSTLSFRVSVQTLSVACCIGLTALLVVAPYLLWNLYSHGGLFPISGTVKQKYNFFFVTQPMGGYFTFDTLIYSIGRIIHELFWTFANSFRIFGGGQPFWLTKPNGFSLISFGILLTVILAQAFNGRVFTRTATSWRSFIEMNIGIWILILSFFWLLYGALNFVSMTPVKQALKALLTGSAILIAVLMVFCLQPNRNLQLTLSSGQRIVMWFYVPIAVHLSILVYTVDYFLNYTKWYFANYFVIIALSTGVLATLIHIYLNSYSKLGLRVAYGVVLVWLAAGFMLSIVFAVARISAPIREPAYGINGQYRIARWIDETLPRDSLVASYNAGVIGYFSNRATINLDGLINNRELVPYLFGPKSMTDYIDAKCPDYLADYVNLDIDPRILFKDVGDGDKILNIEQSRLKPIHWMKSIDFGGIERTFIVFEIEKRFCARNPEIYVTR